MRADIGDVKLSAHNLEAELAIKTEGRYASVAPKQLRPLLPREICTRHHERATQARSLNSRIRRHSAKLDRGNPRFVRQLRLEKGRDAKQRSVAKHTKMFCGWEIVSWKSRGFHWAAWAQYGMPQRNGFLRSDLADLNGRRRLRFSVHCGP